MAEIPLNINFNKEQLVADIKAAEMAVKELKDEGAKLGQEFNKTEKESDELRNKLNRLEREGKQNTEQYKKLNTELKANQTRLNANKQALDKNAKSVDKATELQEQLNKTLSSFEGVLSGGVAGLSAYAGGLGIVAIAAFKLIKPLLETTDALNKKTAAVVRANTAWSNFRRTFIDVFEVFRKSFALSTPGFLPVARPDEPEGPLTETQQRIRQRTEELLALQRINDDELIKLTNDVRANEIDFLARRQEIQASLESNEAIATNPNATPEQRRAATQAFKKDLDTLTAIDADYYGKKEQLAIQEGIRDGILTEAELKNIIDVEAERSAVDRERTGRLKQFNAALATTNALFQTTSAEVQKVADNIDRVIGESVNATDGTIGFDIPTIGLAEGLPDPAVDPEVLRNRELDKIITDDKEQALQERLDLQRSFTEGAVALSAQLFGQESKLTELLLLLSQAQGIAKAVASAPFPLNLPAIAFATASFVAQFATLNKARSEAKFDKGGIIPIGGKRHAQGGTKFYGQDGTTFEAEAGEALILNRGATRHIMPFLDKLNQQYGGNRLGTKSNFLQAGGTIRPSFGLDINKLADAIGNRVAQANRNLPSPQVGLQEFRRQNSRSVRVLDRSTL